MTGSDPVAWFIFMAMLIGLALASTALHEAGHAIAGFLLGGLAKPTGYGYGFPLFGRGWSFVGGRWERADSFFPHVKFEDWSRLSSLSRRILASSGIAFNLLLAIVVLSTFSDVVHVDLYDRLGNGYLTVAGLRNGCSLVSQGILKPVTWREVLHVAAEWLLIINVFSIVANILPVRGKSDGYWIIKG